MMPNLTRRHAMKLTAGYGRRIFYFNFRARPDGAER